MRIRVGVLGSHIKLSHPHNAQSSGIHSKLHHTNQEYIKKDFKL